MHCTPLSIAAKHPCPAPPAVQDLYVLNVEKQTWKRVISPNGCAGWQGFGSGDDGGHSTDCVFPCRQLTPPLPGLLLTAGRCRAPATRRCAHAPRCGCGAASSPASTRWGASLGLCPGPPGRLLHSAAALVHAALADVGAVEHSGALPAPLPLLYQGSSPPTNPPMSMCRRSSGTTTTCGELPWWFAGAHLRPADQCGCP